MSEFRGAYKIFLSKSQIPPANTNVNFEEILMDGSLSYSLILNSAFNDVDGNLIEPDILYYVYVVGSYYCENYISESYVNNGEVILFSKADEALRCCCC